MAIPVLQFQAPPVQPYRPSPVLQGAQQGLGFAQQLQKMKEESQMAPLTQELTKQKIAQAPLTRQMLQAQIGEVPGKERLTAAQTAKLEAEAKMAPLKMAISAAQVMQTGSRFGPAYQLSRWVMSMSSPQRAIWYAQNPEKAKYVENILGTQLSSQQQESPATSLINQLMAKSFPEYKAPVTGQQPQAMPPQGAQPPVAQAPQQDQQQGMRQAMLQVMSPQVAQPPLSQMQPQAAQPALAPGQPQTPTAGQPPADTTLTPQAQQPAISGLSWSEIPEPVLKSGLTQTEQYQYAANRANSPTDANKRATAASGAEYMLSQNRDKYVNMFNQASNYAGAYGKGKAFFDQWARQNPDDVEAYRRYINIFVPAMNNIVKRTEGMGATDSQRDELKGMSNQVKGILNNPEQAKRGMNNFIDMLHDISEGDYASAEPVNRGLYSKIAGSQNWTKGNYLGRVKGQAIKSGWSTGAHTYSDGTKYTKEQAIELAKKRGLKWQ